MKVKVCGMKDAENILEVAELKPDYLGFIFYSRSPRNATALDPAIVKNLPKEIKRVGVFVDASPEEVSECATQYDLDVVQLHGKESPEFCKLIKNSGLEVWKAFSIKNDKDFDINNLTNSYKEVVDIYLFDAAGKEAGGNGVKFNWEILENYDLGVPYLLSGGIGPEDSQRLKMHFPEGCVGIDINSKFEVFPGMKDTKKLKEFIKQLRYEQAP